MKRSSEEKNRIVLERLRGKDSNSIIYNSKKINSLKLNCMNLPKLILVIALLPQVLFAFSNTEFSSEVISNDKLFSMLDTSN